MTFFFWFSNISRLHAIILPSIIQSEFQYFTLIDSSLEETFNNTYITDTLKVTSGSCIIQQGGYAQIGKLVIVNMRLNVTGTAEINISGFPEVNDEGNHMVAVSSSVPTDIRGGVLSTGVLTLTTSSTGTRYISAVYMAK